jgi:hypothetical protein
MNDKPKPQGKCIDVNGDVAIFERFADLAYETGSKTSDPCIALLTWFGNGKQIFQDLLKVDDGWQVALLEEKAVITRERDYTWSVGRGPVQSKKIKVIDLHLKNVEGCPEPLANEGKTERLINTLWQHKKEEETPIRYIVNMFGSLKYLPLLLARCPWITVLNLKPSDAMLLEGAEPGEHPHQEATGRRELFHTYDEFSNLPELKWIINGFAEEFDKIMIGGLSGQAKTLLPLAINRALLTCEALFGYFEVPAAEHKTLYLIPEEGAAKFKRRLKLFGLLEFMRDDSLLVRTLSKGPTVPLTDPGILHAAKGRHVFLDTAVRFGTGDESSARDTADGLAQSIFSLEQAGAASIWGAHHSPKSFEKENYMKLENVLRGSGDIGAMLSTAYGVRQLDDNRKRTWLHIENIKPRDIEPPPPFQLEGKPWIDQGLGFKMISKPGETGLLADYLDVNTGRTAMTDEAARLQAALDVIQEKKSTHKVGKELNVNHTTVLRWVKGCRNEADKLKMDVEQYIGKKLSQEKTFDETQLSLPQGE